MGLLLLLCKHKAFSIYKLVIFPLAFLYDISVGISHLFSAFSVTFEILEEALIYDTIGPYPATVAGGFSELEIAFQDVTAGDAAVEKTTHTVGLRVKRCEKVVVMVNIMDIYFRIFW